MKINVQNLSFGRWVSICSNLANSGAVKPCRDNSVVRVEMNNSFAFSHYEFFSSKQEFRPLPLIDIMLFLRSLTGYFWIKAYYIKALRALQLENRPKAKHYIILALDYYMSKQKEDSIEYLTAFILKEGLNK